MKEVASLVASPRDASNGGPPHVRYGGITGLLGCSAKTTRLTHFGPRQELMTENRSGSASEQSRYVRRNKTPPAV
jgi:hypothetical protein